MEMEDQNNQGLIRKELTERQQEVIYKWEQIEYWRVLITFVTAFLCSTVFIFWIVPAFIVTMIIAAGVGFGEKNELIAVGLDPKAVSDMKKREKKERKNNK